MVHQMIPTNTSNASKASSKSNPIRRILGRLALRRQGRARWLRALASLAAGAVLASCSVTPVQQDTPTRPEARTPDGAVMKPGEPLPTAMSRVRSRWTAVSWQELPGWEDDRPSEWWPSLIKGCERPAQGWDAFCARARGLWGFQDDRALRDWLRLNLQPYRIESLDGEASGLATGYFEPLLEARRQPAGPFRIALHAPPVDLAQRKPWWTRQQIDSSTVVQQSLRGREIAYVADPMDLLVLQIQGSGRLNLVEPDGRTHLVRMAFAGHNDQPYKSVGRWLVDQGEMKLEQASWVSIKAWARRNPQRISEMLWANPRYVFFREEPMPDPSLGPRGAQGVPLTPGRSIAVDRESIPYGTAVWLDTTEPLSATPLRRLVMAQDTGSAITGAVRADYFWGWGDTAEQQASRMKQPLRMWALWPKP